MALSAAQNEFRKMVWAAVGYTPHEEQQVFHDSNARYKLLAGGVGAGKSYCTSREADGYTLTPDGLGWIIGPNYELARPEFDYLLSAYHEELGIVDPSSISDPGRGARKFKLVAEWGAFEWHTKSATDPTGIAGRRPDVVVITEAAQHPGEMFFKAMERAAERRAPVIFSGTFEGSFGWYAEQWQKWQGSNPEGGQSFSLPTWTNRKYYPGGRQDPEILRLERSMPPDLFQERFGGVPCPPVGLVFKEFSAKWHKKPLEELYDPDLPIEIWADPATHCYAALFVQIQADGRTVHVLDEVYARDQIGQQVIPQIVAKPWWKHSCTRGVMDIAGTFRAGANISQVEVWEQELKRLGEHSIGWESVKIRAARDWYDAIHLRLWNAEGHPPDEDDPTTGGPLIYFADTLNDTVNPDGRANGILGEMKTHRWADRAETAALPGRPIKRNEDALSALGYGLFLRFGPVVQRLPKKRRMIRSYF